MAFRHSLSRPKGSFLRPHFGSPSTAAMLTSHPTTLPGAYSNKCFHRGKVLTPWSRHSFRLSHSFAFSGCGWLTPFHLGAIDFLQSKGLINDTTILAGSSGGALAALVGCSGRSPKEAMEVVNELARSEKFRDDIDSGLRSEAMLSFLPKDIVERCNGRLHVVATRLWPSPSTNVTVFNEYSSPQDVLECVAASSFIPLYCGKRLYTHCRGHKYIDGGVLSIMPDVGTVKVSPLPSVIFSDELKPHIYPRQKIPISEIVKQGFIPGSKEDLQRLFDMGYSAAEAWYSNSTRNSKQPVDAAV